LRAGEIDFGSIGVTPPKAASSRTERHSAIAGLDAGSRSKTSVGQIEVDLLAQPTL
jgi:hypothetical protein